MQQGQTVRPHRRQFVLGPSPVLPDEGWVTIPIGRYRHLSLCSSLRVSLLRSADGHPFWLLGHALLGSDDRAIEVVFGERPATGVEAWTADWAGRWVLISEHFCQSDAGGVFGVFYRRCGDRLWASSSSALLAEHLPGEKPAARIKWDVAHRRGMDWIPAPFSPREEVLRLLPLRRLDFSNGSTRPIVCELPAVATEPAKALATRLTTIAANLRHLPETQIFCSLTAGLDTRTVLAALLAAERPVETYTFVRPRVPPADVRIPRRISRELRLVHHEVRQPSLKDEEIAGRKALVEAHTDRGAFDSPPKLYASGQLAFADQPDSLFLLGGTFEIGRCFYWRTFGKASPSVEAILRRLFSTAPMGAGPWRNALDSWIESLPDELPLALDWRDRFYLEQRLGGWLGANQQVWGLLKGTQLPLGNSLAVFDVLLRASQSDRAAGRVQNDAVRLMHAPLTAFPINPVLPHERVLRMAGRAFRMFRRLYSGGS